MSTSYTPGSGSGDRRDGDRAGSDDLGSPGDENRVNDRDNPRPDDGRIHEGDEGRRRHNRRLDPDEDRHDGVGTTAGAAGGAAAIDRESNVAREKEAYGGIKIGSAFFGWLTATGTAVLLTALVAAIGAAVGASANMNISEAAQNPQALQITGAILLGVVLFIAYFAGGYVAGRMARFDGAKQGLAVWLWAIVVAIIVAILSAIAGSQFNILANANAFPRIPINEGTMTTVGIVALVIVVVVTLAGAILGGMTGMRFHRKVDRAGFDLEHEPRGRR